MFKQIHLKNASTYSNKMGFPHLYSNVVQGLALKRKKNVVFCYSTEILFFL